MSKRDKERRARLEESNRNISSALTKINREMAELEERKQTLLNRKEEQMRQINELLAAELAELQTANR